jgi:hypothetical protein
MAYFSTFGFRTGQYGFRTGQGGYHEEHRREPLRQQTPLKGLFLRFGLWRMTVDCHEDRLDGPARGYAAPQGPHFDDPGRSIPLPPIIRYHGLTRGVKEEALERHWVDKS